MAMEHDFAAASASKVTVGNTSTQLLSKKSGRMFAIICNNSDEDIFINLGAAAVQDQGWMIAAGGGIAELSGGKLYRGDIYAICSSGSKEVSILEA